MRPFAALVVCFLALLPRAGAAIEPRADLAGTKGETVYFVLGMLDDYLGRYIVEDVDRVESFYCNEHVVAYVFRAYLTRLADEQGLSAATQEQWRQDCLVSFYSGELSAFINQFYDYEFNAQEGFAVTEHGNKRMASASLPAPRVRERETSLKLAYLAGAYYRYGERGQYRFANSSKKAQLIVDLLKDVGCDSVRSVSQEGLPVHNGVYFVATDDLSRAFERLPGAWALEMADSMVGLASPDEIAIYREIIGAATRGDLDGCPLPSVFDVSRFTFIPMAKRGNIPETVPARVEALADYDRVVASLRSVRDLATDSVRVTRNNQRPNRGSVTTGRIGFSRDGRTAFSILSYHAGPDPRACGRVAAVFLSKESSGWVATGYSLLQ